MEVEEPAGAPRGLLLSLGLVGVLVGAGIAAEFVLNLQPRLSGGACGQGEVCMPVGVGSNTAVNFNPARIIVILGTNATVTFANKDITKHTVTATDGSFNSGDILAGQSWTHTFSTAGTFTYYCIYHGWMRATVVVESQGSSTSGSTTNSTTATSTSATVSGIVISIPAGTGSNTTLTYSPSSITLKAGVNNTITFVNNDNTKHTVTADDGSFNSGDILPGQTWTYTFPVGTHTYHCFYHSWMKGTIIVGA